MQRIIHTVDDIKPLFELVRSAANRTARELAKVTKSKPDGIDLLRRMKFTEMAWHPLDDKKRLNIVEQINQTWTILVSLKALPLLFEWHGKEARGFRLNLGTAAGTDILSLEPDVVAAETFAAVRTSSNSKLTKDLQRLEENCPKAKARYVFFGSRNSSAGLFKVVSGIKVWAVDVDFAGT
jgi:hypothetical protein